MSVQYNPSVVSQGIVTLFDVANPKCYNPSTPTVLSDMVGGQALTIYGSPTYNSNGYITFGNDQTTQYMEANNFSITTGDHTISFWFRPTNMTTRTDQTPLTYAISGDTNYLLMITSGGATTFRVYRSSLFDITVPSMDNKWNFFTRTRIQSTGAESYYMDGQFLASRTTQVGSATVSGGRLIVGQEMDNYTTNTFDANQNLDGDFSLLLIHNRSLSNTEIQQNFNAYRGRYGI